MPFGLGSCDAELVDLDDEVARQLTKGRNIGLRELDAELGSLTVVLESGGSNGQAVDADVSVLLLDHTGKVRSDDDIVFYNQPIALGRGSAIAGQNPTRERYR